MTAFSFALVALLLCCAPAAELLPPPVETVVYAETTDELVFRYDAPGVRGAQLLVEFPWSGREQRLTAWRSGTQHQVRLDVSEIPIMAEIRYAWIIASNDGMVSGMAWEPLARPDPVSRVREWRHLAGTHVDVYAAPGVRDVDEIVAAADAGYERALEFLGDIARHTAVRPRIVVVESYWDYAMLTDAQGEGVAYPRWGVTLQYRGGSDLWDFTGGVIPHEIMHLIDPNVLRADVPAWFREGLAVMNEDPSQHERLRTVLRHARDDGLYYHEWHMYSVPCATGDSLRVWYAQAWSMMEHLGPERAQAMVAEMAAGRHFVAAWRTVVGEPTTDWYATYLRGQARSFRVYVPYILIGIAAMCVALLVYGQYLRWRER